MNAGPTGEERGVEANVDCAKLDLTDLGLDGAQLMVVCKRRFVRSASNIHVPNAFFMVFKNNIFKITIYNNKNK